MIFVTALLCPSPENHEPVYGYCYLVDPAITSSNYNTARDTCTGLGMEIAVLDNEVKQNFVRDNYLLSSV